jgi:hypothetical protein
MTTPSGSPQRSRIAGRQTSLECRGAEITHAIASSARPTEYANRSSTLAREIITGAINAARRADAQSLAI